MPSTPSLCQSAAAAADTVIERTGGKVVLALPLGLGKPNQFVNALYRRVCDDHSLSLTILTALSLNPPTPSNDLERRFLEPFNERVFADYDRLLYLDDMRTGRLPPNVTVSQFYVEPASILDNTLAQQHYISCNYTHAARDIAARGVNVIGQLVAPAADDDGRLSLACNPEVTLDLLDRLQPRIERGETVITVGQLHRNLPYMRGDAEVDAAMFDLLIDDERAHTRLFSTPNMPVDMVDHFVGIHASTLLHDGGTVQIGIGALGDAVVNATLLRQHDNDRYRRLLDHLGAPANYGAVIDTIGGTAPFEQGLYGCSEMLTNGLLELFRADVIRREVFEDTAFQALLDRGAITPKAELATLDELAAHGAIGSRFDTGDVTRLAAIGLLPPATTLDGNRLLLNDEPVANDLGDPATRRALNSLLDGGDLVGVAIHAGFFLGPTSMYDALNALHRERSSRIRMMRISHINELFGNEALKRVQRRRARFLNTVFTATLLGAAASDQLADGRVLSGVGGQYNFVAQAHALADGRSVLMLRSHRQRRGETRSNIVFSYGHNTIPRHLRDIVVTEYGVADLRGKTDAEVVAAMLQICDSRYQDELLEQARDAGKIGRDHRIDERFRYNTPERLATIYNDREFRAAFTRFPLGSDFTDTEQALLAALEQLKNELDQRHMLSLARRGLLDDVDEQRFVPQLQRMGLTNTDGLTERIYRRLLLSALQETQRPAT